MDSQKILFLCIDKFLAEHKLSNLNIGESEVGVG
jgi:hypothetical protein